MLISVVTPTYNRANLLPRLYRSLCNQTCGDFEWIVVDDGSEDETSRVVNEFIRENNLAIRYLHKTNGGKHTAVNKGVNEAHGELVFIADSDDWLPSNSIENIIKVYLTIRGNKEYAGVCGLDAYKDGRVIGSGLSENVLTASYLDIRDKYGVTGDMKEIYLTSVLREFPFPEIEGEHFCSEALVWNRIASKYNLLYFNEVIYIVEYQANGITSAITRARMKNPVATMMTYSEWIKYRIPLSRKIRNAINYWRFAFCTRKRTIKIASWTMLLAPIGWIMHIVDKYKIKL